MEWDSISPVIIIIVPCSDAAAIIVAMLSEVRAAGIIGHPLTTTFLNILNIPNAVWMESDIISPVNIIIGMP